MKAVITLEENSPAKVQIEKSGAQRTVFLPLQQVADFIVSSVKEEAEEPAKAEPIVISPALPPNTVKYAKLSDGTDLIFTFHSETQADVSYHKDVFENVPFPHLVFCFGIRNNRITQKYVFAYKDRILRDSTKLYRFPYSNVYQSGSMCYHDNEPIHDVVQLQSFSHNWMRLGYNDHLYHQGTSNKLNEPLRGVFEKSQNKLFNYDILADTSLTFQTWSERLLK